MQITTNDASVTRIFKDGQLIEEIPVAGPAQPAPAEDPVEDQPEVPALEEPDH